MAVFCLLFVNTRKVTPLDKAQWQEKHSNLPMGNIRRVTSFFMLSYNFYLGVAFKCYHSKLKFMSKINASKYIEGTNYLELQP